MDAMIAAAARALATGDPLGALQRVSLRGDPPSLALRGIAMAQLGEHQRARVLLRQAAQGFGTREPLAHARCTVAEAEVALAMRELGGSLRPLADARAVLEARGDQANALHARLITVRHLLLLGRLQDATAELGVIRAAAAMSPALAATAELARAELALRALDMGEALAALACAHHAAQEAGVPALQAEVAEATTLPDRPAARHLGPLGEVPLRLQEVARLLASPAVVVDGCRRGVQAGGTWHTLARRPVLFTLVRTLALAWPNDAARGVLIAEAFRTRHPDETHRARLRVEIGRLRKLLADVAEIDATSGGFVLRPHGGRHVAVLAPPIDGDQASLLALLGDGAAWSTSALALALGASQRTVQRALTELAGEGRVRSVGRGRTQRWLAPPLAGFTTILLLPTALPPE